MTDWSAYQFHPSFVLGFHGTEKDLVSRIVQQTRREHLQASRQRYDWLGHGVYFWEHDPARGLDWAQTRRGRSIRKPDVIGAIIDLGRCLDLTTISGLSEVRLAYAYYKKSKQMLGQPLANNRMGHDMLLRELDCQVIQTLHQLRKDKGWPAYDSVRAAFPEDQALYEGAGFKAKNHIQLCVLNARDCIKGYFRPIKP